MEIIVNALVLKSVDYKDNDKILTLYSLEKGIITASIKGVKKSGAKLKFASEPFAFCEYVLAQKGDKFTVTGATYIESFYNLRLDMLKYYVSNVILEAVGRLISEGETDPRLFSLIINSVKAVNYSDDELKTLIFFMLELISMLGYEIENFNCASCGDEIFGRVFFASQNAEFYCMPCRTEYAIEITSETHNTMVLLKGKNLEEIKATPLDKSAQIKVLKFLFYYLKTKTETELKSTKSLIEFCSMTE